MKEAIPYQPELDSIDWRTSLRRARHAIVRHVPLILASCGVSLLLLVIYVKTFPPIYRAEVVLLGETNDDVVRSNYYQAWNLFRKGDLKSEPEMITTGRIAKQVVTTLDLKFNDVHHTFLTHVGYLWTDSWLGKSYRRLKEWLFPPDPAAYRATPEEIELARTIDAFRESVSVESVPGTAIGKVVVRAPTYRAAEFANKVVEVYLAERRSAFRAEAEGAYQSLANEVARAEADLAASDLKKYEFDSKNKVVLDFEKDKIQVATWSAMQTSINDLKATIASLEASLAIVAQQLAVEPPEIVHAKTLQDSRIKGMLQAREHELSTTLQKDRERFVATSPEVMQLETFLAETRGAIAGQPDKVEVGQERILNPVYSELRQKQNNLSAQLASAKATLAAKRAPYAELENRMVRIPALVKNVIEQGRIREGLEMRYKLLRDRMMQADVSRATAISAPPSMHIIEAANPPMKPMWPKNLILVPAALGMGLLLGFGMALWAELFSSRVNRDRLVSRPDIPVYAVIDLQPAGLPGTGSGDSRPVVERLRRVS